MAGRSRERTVVPTSTAPAGRRHSTCGWFVQASVRTSVPSCAQRVWNTPSVSIRR
jgi:hypothetical protein